MTLNINTQHTHSIRTHWQALGFGARRFSPSRGLEGRRRRRRRRISSCSIILQRDPGRLLFSQGASLKPDESEGCSPVSGGRTILFGSYWPSDNRPTPLRSSVDTGAGDRGGAPAESWLHPSPNRRPVPQGCTVTLVLRVRVSLISRSLTLFKGNPFPLNNPFPGGRAAGLSEGSAHYLAPSSGRSS